MLNKLSAAVIIAIMYVPTAVAADGYKTHNHGTYGAGGQTIIVSCFRGPWKEVIWDRPNAVFIDSLVNIGYDYPTAQAIGERVCRDDALVGNPGALKSTMRRILRSR